MLKLTKIKISFFAIIIVSGCFLFSDLLLANNQPTNFRAGEVLVKFVGDNELYKLKVASETDLKVVLEKYSHHPKLEYLSLNYLVKATAFPNDPDYSLQWYLPAINAKDAWSKELTAREKENITSRPVIAVLDTGVDLDHPDLKDKIWVNKKEVAKDGIDNDRNGYRDDINGWDFVEQDGDPNPSLTSQYNSDAVKHGTIVSGIAGATSHNQIGISGISWSSQIMPLRVLDSNGTGDIYDVILAIEYAMKNGADVINMSFVGPDFSQPFFEAIKQAYGRNILLVAAAGNTDPNTNGVNLDESKVYPVCYDGENGENMVIGVASIGNNFKKSNFSNYGKCVDLVAPGESFYSTQVYYPSANGFTDYYKGYWSGTSLSAPLVSGTAALVKGLRPNFTAAEIRDFILWSATNVDNANPEYRNKLGSGLLNSAKAVEVALGKTSIVKQPGASGYIVVGLGVGSFPQLKVLKPDGSVFKAFYAYSPAFKGTINVASGDINGDNKMEIITSPGIGGGPHLRIFNIEGQVVSQFFAYEKNLRNGFNITIGDLNNDKIDEIITGPGKGSKPEVKIFDYQGNLLNKFLVYNEKFLGGAKVGTGDVNGDGNPEIITAPGIGGGPHVRIFDINGNLVSQFFAFNQTFRGGVNITVGDLTGDNQAEIVVAAEGGAFPEIKIFSYNGSLIGSFFAYDPNMLKGVSLAIGDIDNDGKNEIITGPGLGGSAEVRTFDFSGQLKLQIIGHDQKGYQGGVRPAFMWY